MLEPVSSTTTGAASVGFLALLIGAFGPVAADVMLVVIAALAGCFIRLSEKKGLSVWQSITFVVTGVAVSLVLAWGLTNIVTSLLPALNGAYTPAIIAMAIGFMSSELPSLFGLVAAKIKTKLGI